MHLGNKPNIDLVAEMIKVGVMVELDVNNPFSDKANIVDFKKFGWCEKWCSRNSIVYQWLGPNPVMVEGKVINTGGYTDEIDVDNT